jgi:hypothetical protein
MSVAGYVVNNTSATALTAATAKTIINIIPSTGRTATIVEFGVSFDGVTASAVPVLVELCSSTQATSGTSTAGTLTQLRGRTTTVGATAGINYSAEPTVLTAIKQWLVTPYGGNLVIQFPLGREPEADATTNKGIAIRVTAPAAVNVRAYAEFEQA